MDKLYLYNPIAVQCSLSLTPVTRDCEISVELDQVTFFFLTSSVTTSAACEKLERDRNELQVAYEGFLQKLNEQHHSDLAELEERLKQFYTAECEKLQSICIEEAEKYKAQLQEQVCDI